jgi:hypothetical protein
MEQRMTKKIKLIKYRSDSEEWVAEVGKRLCGKGRRGSLDDCAVVVSIERSTSPSNCYLVRTDAHPGRTAWENPFLVGSGHIDCIEYFENE